jgi:hypothetical protein
MKYCDINSYITGQPVLLLCPTSLSRWANPDRSAERIDIVQHEHILVRSPDRDLTGVPHNRLLHFRGPPLLHDRTHIPP